MKYLLVLSGTGVGGFHAQSCWQAKEKGQVRLFRTVSNPISPTSDGFFSLLNLFVATVYAAASSLLPLLAFLFLWVVKCPDKFLPF